MPDIKGLNTFKGALMHSALYDTNFDATGKKLALIGGGSSGIQILPKIQPIAARVDHYMKGKTWIPPFGIGALGVINRNGDRKLRSLFSRLSYLRQAILTHRVIATTPKEELEEWKDPKKYLEYRRRIESSLHEASDVLYRDTPNALAFQKMCEDHMRAKLAKKPEIFDALRPSFAPACRRLTPGPGVSTAPIKMC